MTSCFCFPYLTTSASIRLPFRTSQWVMTQFSAQLECENTDWLTPPYFLDTSLVSGQEWNRLTLPLVILRDLFQLFSSRRGVSVRSSRETLRQNRKHPLPRLDETGLTLSLSLSLGLPLCLFFLTLSLCVGRTPYTTPDNYRRIHIHPQRKPTVQLARTLFIQDDSDHATKYAWVWVVYTWDQN